MAEDEIDLKELIRTIGRRRRFLFGWTVLLTVVVLLWTLAQPNLYRSEAVMIPISQDGQSKMGGIGALAGLAGIDIGGGKMMPDEGLRIMLDNDRFMRELLLKYGFDKKLTSPTYDRSFVFAGGMRAVYEMKRSFNTMFFPQLPYATLDPVRKEGELFRLIGVVRQMITITSDKKTGVITVGSISPDPLLARDVTDAFIKEACLRMRQTDMADLDKKVAYYQDEIGRIQDATIKTQVSELMTALIQTRVQAQASEFYNVKMISRPDIPYRQKKEGPKRGAMVIGAMIGALMAGIAWIFISDFFRRENDTGPDAV